MSKKKAVAIGFCKTCRWARELGEKAKKPPFVLDCQALPFVWDVRPTKSAVTSASGDRENLMDVVYLPRIHTEEDFCALYEKMPADEEVLAGEGGPIYGVPLPPLVPRKTDT